MTSCVHRALRLVLHMFNPSVIPLVYDEEMEWKYYRALDGVGVWNERFDELEESLKAGADPNHCAWVTYWVDSNPLFVLVNHPALGEHLLIDEEGPQIRALRLLHEYGADIRRRPYIWFKVYKFDNEEMNRQLEFNYYQMAKKIVDNEPETEDRDNIPYHDRVDRLADQMEREDSEREMKFQQYVDYYNKVISVLLEMGADPDQKGHPFPFTREAIKKNMNDKKAAQYFSQGTRAINEAIEKGMRWESQVDLLLQYTELDEESLNAAQRSNDPKMIEKIDILWKKQKKIF